MTESSEPRIAWYDARADELAERYEALAFTDVHGWLSDWLPAEPGAPVLDVGAGSGRDAAWLAGRGYAVVAVEPAAALREAARHWHPEARIQWLGDQLPRLEAVHRLGRTFELILLSAVWMHLAPAERDEAFRSLLALLRPGGVLAVTLRLGEPDAERGMYPVSVEELQGLAEAHGARLAHSGSAADALGRPGVSWGEVVIRSSRSRHLTGEQITS